MKFIFFVIFNLLVFLVGAQPVFTRDATIPVSNFGTPLKNAWAGGLNFTEWSAIDLDLDGIKDLAIYDKSGEKIRTFKNDDIAGTASYTHAPQFQNAFPTDVNSWAVFYDFNNDGKADLFTYALGLGGVRVYKNTSTPGNLQFTFYTNFLKSDYNPNGVPNISNLPSSSVAVPGLADIDNDGDMDILTFQTSGIQLEWHKNMSMERYGHLDSLAFDMVDGCWGDAVENNCEATLNYQFCPLVMRYNEAVKNNPNNVDAVMHAGSCMMCIDMDGDNDKEVVLGDISCDSVEYFRNAGSTSNANFDYATKLFPNATDPIAFKQFPCTYFLDLDNDGIRDLIAAPNIQTSENYRGAWYYKNIGADNIPNFSLIKKNFLQDEMLEFGEGSYPTTFDYDGDGDLDIIVGNFGYYQPVSLYSSRLAVLQNVGTTTLPSFNTVNLDYMSLSTYNLKNMAPSFGDMDGDGDKDMIVGDITGRLTYFTNTAGAGNVANFTLTADFTTGFLAGIDVGNNAYPQIIDVNKDGLLDLLVGEYDGSLNYYKNVGTANNPVLSLVITNFGGVKVNRPGYYEAHSTPFMFDDNGSYKLMVGSDRGYLYMFGNIDGNLNGNFTLIDSTYNDIYEGEQMAPTLADFNADGKLDLVVGNYSGGLAYFKGVGTFGIEENIAVYSEMNLFPIPVQNELNLSFNDFNNQLKEITIIDGLGREIKSITSKENNVKIEMENLVSGFYVLQCKIIMPDNRYYFVTEKFVKN